MREFIKGDTVEIPSSPFEAVNQTTISVKYYTESDGVSHKDILHGSTIVNGSKIIGKVMGKVTLNDGTKCYLVRYTDKKNKHVQLGFLKEDLILIKKGKSSGNLFNIEDL